mgnify:CR=1 FL=1
MTVTKLDTKRFTIEPGHIVYVQVPEPQARELIGTVCGAAGLEYGDYDQVAFTTASGVQQFRSLGTGRNAATEGTVEVPCVEVSFFVEGDEEKLTTVLEAVYHIHPYEEPVAYVVPGSRTLHVRGMDEDNPNRFWNREPQDWVPQEHR